MLATVGGVLTLTGVGAVAGIPLLAVGGGMGLMSGGFKLTKQLANSKSTPFNAVHRAIENDKKFEVKDGQLKSLDEYMLVAAITSFTCGKIKAVKSGDIVKAGNWKKEAADGLINTASVVLGGVTLVWDVANAARDINKLSNVELSPRTVQSLADKLRKDLEMETEETKITEL